MPLVPAAISRTGSLGRKARTALPACHISELPMAASSLVQPLLVIGLAAGGEDPGAFPAGPDAFIQFLEHGQHGLLETRFPVCSLQSLTCLQVQVLPRQWMVGPSSDSRPWLGETLVGASSAVNGRACRRRRAVGGDWPAALANVQAATLRENCRPEIASSSEASEEGNSEPPNHDRNGEGSYDRGISHQTNSVSRRGRGSGM